MTLATQITSDYCLSVTVISLQTCRDTSRRCTNTNDCMSYSNVPLSADDIARHPHLLNSSTLVPSANVRDEILMQFYVDLGWISIEMIEIISRYSEKSSVCRLFVYRWLNMMF